jgi:membrane-associated protease RseP (regulator of RpoE activity)
MPPPWGCYYSTVPVGAIALTVAGMAMLYSDGTYYKTTYVEGATQYQVVAPPAGASLPAGTSLPADRASITIAGVTYYLYGNTFYKRVVTNGQESFVVVTKPAGVVAVKALPEDFEPMQAGSMVYFRSKDRYYLNYLDPGGEELFLVVDAPKGAVPAVPDALAGAEPKAAAAAPTAASAAKPQAVTLTAPANTPLTVRVATEVNSGTAQAGQRFQGNLDSDLVADGRVVATRGTKVYGRVVAAKAGTGTGGAPQLSVELTDIEVGGRVIALATEPVSFSGEAKKAGKKVVGGAALGAGIGGMIDGGEGAGWGAAAGAVVGVAAAKSSPGNQVAVAAGTALEFRLARPLSVDIVV